MTKTTLQNVWTCNNLLLRVMKDFNSFMNIFFNHFSCSQPHNSQWLLLQSTLNFIIKIKITRHKAHRPRGLNMSSRGHCNLNITFLFNNYTTEPAWVQTSPALHWAVFPNRPTTIQHINRLSALFYLSLVNITAQQ